MKQTTLIGALLLATSLSAAQAYAVGFQGQKCINQRGIAGTSDQKGNCIVGLRADGIENCTYSNVPAFKACAGMPSGSPITYAGNRQCLCSFPELEHNSGGYFEVLPHPYSPMIPQYPKQPYRPF